MDRKTEANQANSLWVSGKTEDANADMVEGYLDGFDPSNPEPSQNRSHSYRHGFANGRADSENRCAFASADVARRRAAEAMQMDATA